MTTKTTKKQAESTPEVTTPKAEQFVQPESAPDVSTIVDAPPAEAVGELSTEEKALIAAVRSTEGDAMTPALGAFNTAYAQHHPKADSAPGDEGAGRLSEDEWVELIERLDPTARAMFSGTVDGLHRKQFFDDLEASSQRHEVERQKKVKAAKEIAQDAEYLDDVARLSLFVIGKLALSGVLTRTQIHEDGGNGLYWLFRDIDGAIREALPDLSIEELDCVAEAERAGISTAYKDSDDKEVDDEADGDELPKSA